MKGHEYVREAFRTYLEATVPARLTAHLTANNLSSPDPADISFVLGDGLQDVVDFPVVVVRSTDATDDKRSADGTWWMAYSIELIVACEHRVHNDGEAASKDRDRVMLAVREAIYSTAGLTNDIDISPKNRPEATGAATETRAGVPLAAGTLKFTARVLETLAPLNPPETITNVDTTVTGKPADETL